MATTITLTPGQVEYLCSDLEHFGSVRFAAQPGTTFELAEPIGVCPACDMAVYIEDEPDMPVWTCPADLQPSNSYREEPAAWITEELREREGCFSNCAEDFGAPCYERMPLHVECYERGDY